MTQVGLAVAELNDLRGIFQPFGFCDFQLPALSPQMPYQEQPPAKEASCPHQPWNCPVLSLLLHFQPGPSRAPESPREGRDPKDPRPTSFITSKEQLLPPRFRFLMQFLAEAERDLPTPTPALPRSRGRRGLLCCCFHSGVSSVLGCSSLGDQRPGALHKGLKQFHS